MEQRTYLAIDLKSFYASAECAALGLDPLSTNLVVADVQRTEKTICLAVSPSLKAYGLPGRARLFEVEERMRLVNEARRLKSPGRRLSGESWDAERLVSSPSLGASYLAVKPRMAYYLEVSASIYGIYLRYAAPEDIHVYSIDEVFIDVTRYLRYYGKTAHELARTIVRDILDRTGITATAGIGSNLYLAKVAMDIVAKHMPADRDGVRIAQLDESSYRRMLWSHRPLTDFWRVGHGYARRLVEYGLTTMGDIARCSLGGANEFYGEDLLYRLFGVNAELLIDHAWGREPCTIEAIKAYRPSENSISSGQVLHCAYPYERARVVVREMADALALDLAGKRLETDRIGLYVGYDRAVRNDDDVEETSTDRYRRMTPKAADGWSRLARRTSSGRVIVPAMTALFDRLADPRLNVRRLTVVAANVKSPSTGIDSTTDRAERHYEQPDLFAAQTEQRSREGSVVHAWREPVRRDDDVQRAMLAVKAKFGRNAVLRGMNFEEGATGRDRNEQIGGHAAGQSMIVRTVPGEGRIGNDSKADPDLSEMPEAKIPAWINGDARRLHPMPLVADPGAHARARRQRMKTVAQEQSQHPVNRAMPEGAAAYADIIGMDGPRQSRHPSMSIAKRAAQFMPFAALTGYESVLERTERDIETRYAEHNDPVWE